MSYPTGPRKTCSTCDGSKLKYNPNAVLVRQRNVNAGIPFEKRWYEPEYVSCSTCCGKGFLYVNPADDDRHTKESFRLLRGGEP